MTKYSQILKKEMKPYYKTALDDIRSRRNKDFFRYTGTQIYAGKQGSGKTASAVYHVLKLKDRYPRSILVSNLSLTGMDALTFGTSEELDAVIRHLKPESQYIKFSTFEELSLALTRVNNGFLGVVYLIDEIHTYLNALESKNVPMYIFTEISQQRKQRKLIIGTSQLFMRVAKPLREQCDTLIICRTLLGVITLQSAYDGTEVELDVTGKLVGTKIGSGWFIQTRKLRESYDTYQKVVSGQSQMEFIEPAPVYSKRYRKPVTPIVPEQSINNKNNNKMKFGNYSEQIAQLPSTVRKQKIDIKYIK